MKAFEYYGQILETGQLSLPMEIRRRLPLEGEVRIMVFLDEKDLSWDRTAMAGFEECYGEEDCIYDTL